MVAVWGNLGSFFLGMSTRGKRATIVGRGEMRVETGAMDPPPDFAMFLTSTKAQSDSITAFPVQLISPLEMMYSKYREMIYKVLRHVV
jgi:hypothetical protein